MYNIQRSGEKEKLNENEIRRRLERDVGLEKGKKNEKKTSSKKKYIDLS